MEANVRSGLVTVLAFATLMLVAPGASGSFGAPTNFGADDGPQSVVVGEFNGDAYRDLAVANYFSNNVSVLLGAPGGIFGPPANIAVGTSPKGVAVGEFNGDADPDLAVAYYGGGGNDHGGVSVLLGGAGASFAGANFFAGENPGSVAVGDFNGDADSDLAIGNNGSDNVSVLLGGAGGGFGLPTNFPVGSFPSSIAVGNFNGGSDPDLAVTSFNDDNVSVLLGGPGGGFGVKTDYTTGGSPNSVAAQDLNGDGDPDLATANWDNNVSVLLGGAGGGFGLATNFAVGGEPNSVAVGDVNGDTDPDLAVASIGSDNVSVLLGRAPSSFMGGGSFAVGHHPASIAAADLNGDSRRDLVTANNGGDNVSVLLNRIDVPEITAIVPNSPANDNNPKVTGTGAEANSTVKVYGDSTCTGAVLGSGSAANFNGATGVTATVLGDQTTNLRVTATDTAGNASACSALRSYTEDSTPPDTQIDTSPPDPSSDNTGDFEFSSTLGGISFQCRVDTASFTACSSPHATAALSDGSHTFEVRAVDAANNVDRFPSLYTWTVDTVPVAAPTISDTDPNSPANDNEPEVKGSGAEANSTVRLYSNRSCTTLIGSGSAADFNGATGITATVPGDQTTNMWVTATDLANVVSGCTLGFSYTEDSTGPTPPTINDTNPDSPANDNLPEVRGTGAEAGSTVRIYNNANRSCTNLVGTGSAAEFSGATGITATVPSDVFSNLRATATDQAGNPSSCSGDPTFSYREDSTAPATPAITVTSPASPANDNTPEVKGTGAEADSTVSLYANSTCIGAVLGTGTAADFNGVGGITGTVPGDQTTNLHGTATDQAGNVSGCSNLVAYTEDSTSPGTQIDTSPPSPSRDSTGDLTFSSTGGASSLECRIDAEAFSLCSSPHATAVLTDGPHTFEARAIDASGNIDLSPASHTWTVDTIAPPAPSITATSPASPANDNTPEVKGTGAEADSTVTIYADPACTGAVAGSGSAANFNDGAGITATVAGDQATDLRSTATDQAGNVSICSNPFAYTEDSTILGPPPPPPPSTNPETTIVKQPKRKTKKKKATFVFESSDAGSTFACKLDAKPFGPCSSPTTYKKLRRGKHTFQVQATNPAGKTDATPATATWKVKKKVKR